MGLVICGECNRHLRRRESHCPFCGAEISAEVRASPERPLPAARLSRAALLAFAAASVGTACGGKETDTGSGNVGEPSNGGSGGTGAGGILIGPAGDTSVPVYGAPSEGRGGRISSGGTSGKGGFFGTGGFINPPPPPYGTPPPPPPTGGGPGIDIDAGPDATPDAGEIVRDAASKD